MKAFAKIIGGVILLLIVIVVVVGPGKIVAGVEYPFGVGPLGSTGQYCHDINTVSRLFAQAHRAGEERLNTGQEASFLAFEKTLTHTGPVVPRADFTAFFRRSKNSSTTMTADGALLNTWWNQNCTEALMEAPSALGKVWSGIGVRNTFAHYPKNVIKVDDFEFAIR